MEKLRDFFYKKLINWWNYVENVEKTNFCEIFFNTNRQFNQKTIKTCGLPSNFNCSLNPEINKVIDNLKFPSNLGNAQETREKRRGKKARKVFEDASLSIKRSHQTKPPNKIIKSKSI